MNDLLLKKYNSHQRGELQRVYDEIKWYLGEYLRRDPSESEDDLKIVNERLAEVILNGFGCYLSSLKEQQAIITESMVSSSFCLQPSYALEVARKSQEFVYVRSGSW